MSSTTHFLHISLVLPTFHFQTSVQAALVKFSGVHKAEQGITGHAPLYSVLKTR